MTKVSIGIPAYRRVSHDFYVPFAMQLLQMEKAGIHVNSLIAVGSMAADIARNSVVHNFLKTDSDWLLWWDDDNTPQMDKDAFKRLLSIGKTCVTGVYVKRDEKREPLAYMKAVDGKFVPLQGYTDGEIIQIDSAGMGFSVVHRTVFEAIKDKYETFRRVSGGSTVIHIDDIVDMPTEAELSPDDGKVIAGVLHERLRPHKPEHFPFFLLENGLTEDVMFWQRAARVGHPLFLDTKTVIGHIGDFTFMPHKVRNG